MAVEKRQPTASTEAQLLIKDYWPRYHKHAILTTILMQVTATLAIGLALIVNGIAPVNATFWITLIAIAAASIGMNILLVNQLLGPLHSLADALTHVSGEKSAVTPPNPNAPHHAKNGFKPLLQLIYEQAANSAETPASTTLPAPQVDLAAALNNTAAGFAVLTAQGKLLYANDKTPVQVNAENETTLELLFEDDISLEDWLKQCEEKEVRAEHFWNRAANKPTGEEGRKLYDVIASYEKGSEAEVVLTLFDRTDIYQPEDEDLDFLAFAAHELRGPITVIRGYLDVLGDELTPKLEDDQAELFSRLVVSASRLSSYVNNILNTSRYDRRHLKMHLVEDRLADIYDSIRDDMELRASSQNRLLAVHLDSDLPTVAADRASVSEVLSNLIDNAIKYSNEGGSVAVTAAQEGDFVKVMVEDRGIGMPSNVVSNLFHKFYRSHRSRETVAGTGIGLYICKAIVESHGGKIGVRSTEEVGSVFEFTLPIYNTVADKLHAAQESNVGLIQHNQTGWIKNHAMYRG